MSQFTFDQPRGVRSAWNAEKLLRRGKLTDAQIARYERKGWYDPDFKEARRAMMARRKARRDEGQREGNYVRRDGRLVYSPI